MKHLGLKSCHADLAHRFALTRSARDGMIQLMENEALQDLFAGLGPITIRRMFGGKGVYHNGVIIAVELRGELMLKADAQSAPEFEAAGCTQWTYVGSRHGKTVAMPYWSVPDEAVDGPDGMAPWARLAYEAGLRAGK